MPRLETAGAGRQSSDSPRPPKRRRVLALIQFDAVGLPLVERMLAEGTLPTLAELRGRGDWIPLETPATHFAAATYHTLYSGLDVGEHGLYYAFQWSAPEQRIRFRRAFPAPPAVWERLARAGRRSLVLDPYESQPPRETRGACVSGWQFENMISLQRWAAPAAAERMLAGRYGRAPLVQEVFGRPSVRSLLQTRKIVLESPRRLADAAVDLLARRDFDLVWASFLAPHLAGHLFWDLSQIEGGELDEGTTSVLETTLADVYRAVDAALERVIDALPDGADVIVFSPLGMDVQTSRSDLLPEMLAAVLDDGASTDDTATGDRIWRLRDAVPTSARAAVARTLPRRLALELTGRLHVAALDWTRTRAFVLPNDQQGHIRVNLRGREREGIVEPAQLDTLLDEIRDGLSTFRDPDGSLSVASVDRVSDVVGRGARLSFLPDLNVRWSDRPATDLSHVSSPRFGTVRRRGAGMGRSGGHTDQAWALVVPGRSRRPEPGRPGTVVDIAATACALFGADRAGLAGEPLLEHAGTRHAVAATGRSL